MIFLVLLAIAIAFAALTPTRIKMGGIRASRSVANSPAGYATCGNCHGTGSEGLGLADWGECEACKGRGSFEIDPNAKTMNWDEFVAYCEKTSVKDNSE